MPDTQREPGTLDRRTLIQRDLYPTERNLVRKHLALAIALLLLFPATAHARVLGKAETRKLVTSYAKVLHVSPTWITKAAIDAIYTGVHPSIPDELEARESGGDEKAGRDHVCKGLLAFDPGWHATKRMKRMAKSHHHKVSAWRLCGECSLYRFVKSYHDGGKPAIRRHWRATLGR